MVCTVRRYVDLDDLYSATRFRRLSSPITGNTTCRTVSSGRAAEASATRNSSSPGPLLPLPPAQGRAPRATTDSNTTPTPAHTETNTHPADTQHRPAPLTEEQPGHSSTQAIRRATAAPLGWCPTRKQHPHTGMNTPDMTKGTPATRVPLK